MGKIAYEKVGLSVRDLQIKLFDDFREDTRSMDRLERFCHLKALMLRIDNVTKNKKDLLMVLGLSVYRQGLLMSELAVLDGQKVSSYFEEVASTLNGIPCQFIPDTCADMSIVPEEMVQGQPNPEGSGVASVGFWGA